MKKLLLVGLVGALCVTQNIQSWSLVKSQKVDPALQPVNPLASTTYNGPALKRYTAAGLKADCLKMMVQLKTLQATIKTNYAVLAGSSSLTKKVDVLKYLLDLLPLLQKEYNHYAALYKTVTTSGVVVQTDLYSNMVREYTLLQLKAETLRQVDGIIKHIQQIDGSVKAFDKASYFDKVGKIGDIILQINYLRRSLFFQLGIYKKLITSGLSLQVAVKK